MSSFRIEINPEDLASPPTTEESLAFHETAIEHQAESNAQFVALLHVLRDIPREPAA